jgi:glycosyltransferase involved in cell wall biosynthesis
VVKNNTDSNKMIIGIDASNLRQGGGLTHLIELLAVIRPEVHNFQRIIVWGDEGTLNKLISEPWLIKIFPKEFQKSFPYRFFWQRFKISSSAKDNECDLLFIPGGSFSCSFRPIVTMSRNMLPFEWTEAKRYGFSLITLRIIILRWLQSRSFRSANGVIFLTDYAKNNVTKVTGRLTGVHSIIPHGLNERFQIEPKEQLEISSYNEQNPFQLLYVSIIDQYKHQWHVIDAVAQLRDLGYSVVLNLVGPAYPSSLKRLSKKIDMIDKKKTFIKYHGSIPYNDLHSIYKKSHLGIFASSCENMPNILIETMAAGLPIACSNRGPMPEVLGDAGLYFNPESPNEIFNALESYITNPLLRYEKASASFSNVQKYAWTTCAKDTFTFLELVLSNHNKSLCAE